VIPVKSHFDITDASTSFVRHLKRLLFCN